MAAEFLRCCICPKQLSFSDTSHLLTHVSSKGHLSHLHKLQVRSHQEESAGQRLAIYNQWYTRHNIALLLSERMQQKEKKQARRKADNESRGATAKQGSKVKLDPDLVLKCTDTKAESHEYMCTGHSDQSRFMSTSALAGATDVSFLASSQPVSPLPQVGVDHDSWSYGIQSYDPIQAGTVRHSGGTTPEMARLKGTIWPGMDLFDSADEETQRKRNQRKDLSVLERMRIMSELVEPMETVCSPGGTTKKRRHMDHLEDDSPVEGESPLAKQSLRRKRKPLAEIRNNGSRTTHRKPKSENIAIRSVTTPVKQVAPVSDSAISNWCHSTSSLRKPALQNFLGQPPRVRVKRPDFDVFTDISIDSGMNLMAAANPNLLFGGGLTYPHATQLASPPPTWLHSSQLLSETYDPFRDHETSPLAPEIYRSAIADKENFNPLMWQVDSKSITFSPVATTHNSLEDFEDSLGALAEVYAFNRNPSIGVADNSSPTRETTENWLVNKHGHIDAKTPLRL